MINQDPKAPSPESTPPGDTRPADPAILDRRASRDQLEWLAQKGWLDRAGLERALVLAGVIPTAESWRRFLDYTLLALGLAFFLSGVIFSSPSTGPGCTAL